MLTPVKKKAGEEKSKVGKKTMGGDKEKKWKRQKKNKGKMMKRRGK